MEMGAGEKIHPPTEAVEGDLVFSASLLNQSLDVSQGLVLVYVERKNPVGIGEEACCKYNGAPYKYCAVRSPEMRSSMGDHRKTRGYDAK